MPFTFSHPAIVLPLAKASNRWFSLTGLVVGSMAPDFEYFIRMKVLSIYSHTLFGLIWFNIPVGLAVAFTFHGIVRNRLIDNLPSFLAYRFSPFKSLDWIYYYQHNRIKVISSMLIGAVSHIAWDSFTHETGMMVETIAFLQTSVLVAGKEIQTFKLLQHGSSFAGALVIVLAVLSLTVLPFKKRENPLYWIRVAIIAAFVLSLRVASGLDPRDLARSFLLKTKDDELILELLKDGVKSTIAVPALLPTSFKYRQDFEVTSKAPGYYLIKKDIGYLLPSKFKSKNLPEIKTLFKETKGIILDMRCYPSDYMISKLGDYLKPHRSPFVKFAATNLEQPGLFKYTLTNENGGGNGENYTGKVVILVNERTQSLAEFTTMALQGSPNVTVIGSTTAGADGNVTHFKLPGGINTSFSGLGVYYPDGSETQRVGIKIDISIKPTIAGIKAGRDELLEKAFDLIEK